MKLFDENRKRLAAALKGNSSTPKDSVVLLQAGGEQGKHVFVTLITYINNFFLILLNYYYFKMY